MYCFEYVATHEEFTCNNNFEQLMQVSSTRVGPSRSRSPFNSMFIAVLLGIVALCMFGLNITRSGIPLIFMFLLRSMGPRGFSNPIFMIIHAVAFILAFCGFNVSYHVCRSAIIAILYLRIEFGPSGPDICLYLCLFVS